MRQKKTMVCCLVIISFLFVQMPAFAQAKQTAANKGPTKITQNTPQIKTTSPEPIATGGSGANKKKVLWGVLGGVAVLGLIAAIVGGGSSGGGGSDGPGDKDTEGTGSVQVEW